MLSLSVSSDNPHPLVEQIVGGIRRQIDARHLRPGSKLPSIRDLAEACKVSRFTVVEAYDRLVAMGYLRSRRGSGFYAASPHAADMPADLGGTAKHNEELGAARVRVVRAFERIGLETFVEPDAGMFLWARFPQIADSLELAERAPRDGSMLAPGTVFRPHLERSPWMRFNVAVCDDPRIQRWLEGIAAGKGTGA